MAKTKEKSTKTFGFELPEAFSNIVPNRHLLHLNVLRQLSNSRAGTACVKTRSEVRGGGAKPWKQKGTGRARAGSIRSPLWVGGGVMHGPKPRDYETNIPKKARNIAFAQSIVSRQESLIKVKSLPALKEIKTKEALKFITELGVENSSILVIGSEGEANFNNFKRSLKNVKSVFVTSSDLVGVYEILKYNYIVITEAALSEIEKRLSPSIKKKKGAA